MVSDLAVVAGAAGGIGSLVAALVAVAAYFINRGRSEGKLEILTKAVGDLKKEVEESVNLVRERAESAHGRANAISEAIHDLRELVARDYVTYERMREFKAELMTAIKSQADSVATIHARLDTLIHNIARIDKRSQDA
jgi:hypothetical protein